MPGTWCVLCALFGHWICPGKVWGTDEPIRSTVGGGGTLCSTDRKKELRKMTENVAICSVLWRHFRECNWSLYKERRKGGARAPRTFSPRTPCFRTLKCTAIGHVLQGLSGSACPRRHPVSYQVIKSSGILAAHPFMEEDMLGSELHIKIDWYLTSLVLKGLRTELDTVQAVERSRDTLSCGPLPSMSSPEKQTSAVLPTRKRNPDHFLVVMS